MIGNEIANKITEVSTNCFIIANAIDSQLPTFAIVDTKPFVRVLTLSTLSNFQEINRFFVLSFEDSVHRTSYKRDFLPTVKIKYYNVMIDGQNVFDQPVKNDIRTYI